jgi:hypothetical protein
MTHVQTSDLIQMHDAARIAGVAPQSLYRLTKNGKLYSIHRGGAHFIRRIDLDRYMAERDRRLAAGLAPNAHFPVLSVDAPAPEEDEAIVLGPPAPDPAAPTPAPPKPEPTMLSASAPEPKPFAAARARIMHELGAVRHQLQGALDQVAALEQAAEQLMQRESRLAEMLAKTEEVAAFMDNL